MNERQIPFFVRLIAVIVTLSVTSLGMQDRAWGMLAPASTSPSATASTEENATRAADLETIQKTLEAKVVRQRLHELGYDDRQIQSRISRLSDRQVHQMASQIRTLNPAGDGLLIGLAVLVLLIVLIIYFIKRI